MGNVIRRVRFKPYAAGTTFNLEMRDSPSGIAYTLSMREGGKRTDLFEGYGFIPSCLHARDSDRAVAALMGFLTSSSAEQTCSQAQIDFFSKHADALSAEVSRRFERS